MKLSLSERINDPRENDGDKLAFVMHLFNFWEQKICASIVLNKLSRLILSTSVKYESASNYNEYV